MSNDEDVESGQPDVRLTPALARELQTKTRAEGDLLIWTICNKGTKDYPGFYTARPHSSRANAPYNGVLLSRSLQRLREQLPLGLTWLNRAPDDDPVIVETWL